MKALGKELLKTSLNIAQGSFVRLARFAHLIDFPVPPHSSMRKTSSKTIKHYYVSGISCYLPIVTMALHYKVDLRSPICVLDFGCGVARELLHFVKNYPKPKYFACDVDRTSVAFVAKNFDVQCYTNQFQPPLVYDAQTMDMIYSVSTFSHLAPEDHLPWLKELFRITRPGGYCFLTTEGDTALEIMKDVFTADDKAQFRASGLLYREYDFLKAEQNRRIAIPIAKLAVGITGSYGNTVMSPDYIRKTWPASGFEITDIIEGIIDHRQDLIILRRPLH